MQATYCSLKVGYDKLEIDSSLIAEGKKYLSLALELARLYDALNNSIFWKTARPSVKKRVKQQLNIFAFDCYTNFIAGCDCLNAYVEKINGTATPPNWWSSMIVDFTLAYNALLREHKREIASKQLSLWENHMHPMLSYLIQAIDDMIEAANKDGDRSLARAFYAIKSGIPDQLNYLHGSDRVLQLWQFEQMVENLMSNFNGSKALKDLTSYYAKAIFQKASADYQTEEEFSNQKKL